MRFLILLAIAIPTYFYIHDEYWYYRYVRRYEFWILFAIGAFFALRHLYRNAVRRLKLPAELRNHKGTELDFFGRHAQLITDVNAGTIRVYRDKKKLILPIEEFTYHSRAREHSVSGEKVASGIVGGRLMTMRTGEYYNYTVPDGTHEIVVELRSAGYLDGRWISFIEDTKGLEEFKKVADRIFAVAKPIIERKKKEAAERKALEERLAAETLEKEKREKEEATRLAQERANQLARQFVITECGIQGDNALAANYTHYDDGRLKTCIAAGKDGRGGMIYNEGSATWIGSWKGAKVEVSGNNLEIVVDDPEYREKNFAERRVTMEFLNKEQRMAWFDRINILSKG